MLWLSHLLFNFQRTALISVGLGQTIGGYEAYVVNAIAKSGKYLVTWVSDPNDGKIHYVSLEGDGKL